MLKRSFISSILYVSFSLWKWQKIMVSCEVKIRYGTYLHKNGPQLKKKLFLLLKKKLNTFFFFICEVYLFDVTCKRITTVKHIYSDHAYKEMMLITKRLWISGKNFIFLFINFTFTAKLNTGIKKSHMKWSWSITEHTFWNVNIELVTGY